MKANDDEPNYRQKMEIEISKYVAWFQAIPWPEMDTPEWDGMVAGWVSAFGEHRYSPGGVAKAMLAMQRQPPKFLEDHLPALLKHLGEQSRDHPASAPEFEDCPHCGGNAWATIYRSDYRGDESIVVHDPIHNKSKRVYLRITAPCVCKPGRRAYASCMNKNTKVVDIAEMPRGWSFDEYEGRRS